MAGFTAPWFFSIVMYLRVVFFEDGGTMKKMIQQLLGTLSIDNDARRRRSQPKEDWVEGFVLGGKKEC